MRSDTKGQSELNSWMYKLGENLTEHTTKGALPKFETDLETAELLGTTTADREELEEACRNNLNFLAAVAMPTIFQFDFPPVLCTAWQLLTENAASPAKLFPQLALGIPRGHAKTTLIKLFILHCILFSQKKFILVICSTGPNAENIIGDVATMLDEPNIVSIFGDWKTTREISRQELKKFSYKGRDIVLGALGSEGSIRGLNINHVRPDIMIFDDIQTKECSESATQSGTLERWMIGTAMKAKSPYGCTFIFVGNMYPGPNSILKKLKKNPTWVKFVQGAILADGTALWPELHSIGDLIRELDNDMAMGHPEIFFSEVMNDTEAGINNRVDLSRIKEWPWGEVDKPQAKFIIIDPSSNKETSDAVGIGYFEVYDGIPAMRQVIEERLSPGNTIRKALILALETGTRIIAIESTAYQYSLLYWFTEVCRQLGISGIEAVDVYSGSYSKNSRISDMLKALTSGEIIVHGSVRSAVTHQIANWNPMKKNNVDNILDLLSYAPKVIDMYGPSLLVEDSLIAIEASAARVVEFNSSF